ncbi:MAG: AAA family ATPase [Prevotella sp.]|jgi:RecA-family ATPase
MSESLNLFSRIADEVKDASKVSPSSEQPKDQYEIDLSEDYPEPVYTMRFNGIGTFPRGDIQAVKAKSKNGKTFLCSILIAVVLGCKRLGDWSAEIPDASVCLFDTEQNPRNTAKVAKRVHALLGWDSKKSNDRFRVYALRTMDADKRFDYIERVIRDIKPTFVVIDGIADLMMNFNDNVESEAVIERMMRISAECDCSLCCVLHTNKAKDDSNMKGHIGTLLLQKASDVLEVTKKADEAIFNVEETDSRNIPIEKFAFTLDGDGIPMMSNYTDAREISKVDKVQKVMNDVFKDSTELGYNELVHSYALNAAASDSTGKRDVKFAKEKGIIMLTTSGKYSLSKAQGSGITPYK